MSPEQVLGQPAGPASDVFSLGTITYELLSGQHPFAAATPVDTMHRILHETPPAPSKLNKALPGALDFVLAKALAKDPARRYANARELDIDLETCQAGLVPASTTPTTGRGPRAIAVLPFKNIGGSPDLNYLGVGLADAVITRLSSSPDLIVRATMSIARYENQPVDPRTVARELDVTAVLDASFQRVGERFRATARLVESPSGQALWAGKVDLDFDDIFEVQDQVAHGIATALTARLAQGSAVEFTPSAEAFELYMRGQESMRVGTRAGLLRSIELMQRAVAIEPRYADAWAQLASAFRAMTDGGFDHDPSWFERADEACRRALAVDPDHALAGFQMGTLHLVRGRKREAYRAFVEAYRRMPNDSTLVHYIAYLLRLCDMLPEAFAAERHSIELDPTSPWQNWMMFRLYFESGELAKAVEALEHGRARFPDHPRIPVIEIALARAQGRYAEALERIENLGMASELAINLHLDRARSLIGLGRAAETGPHVAKVDEAGELDMDYALSAAELHGVLGERDRAFHFLERAVQLGNDSLYAYELPGNLDAIKDDPRWGPFIAGVRARVAEYKREFRWPPA
jgi:TolB-like protein/cytochrome c-type biogenesis protein CcmH/NrfG